MILFRAYGSPGRLPAEMHDIAPPILAPHQCISLARETVKLREITTYEGVGLLLTMDETSDVIRRFCMMTPENPRYSQDLQQGLYQLTGGMWGGLQALLNIIKNNTVCSSLLNSPLRLDLEKYIYTDH